MLAFLIISNNTNPQEIYYNDVFLYEYSYLGYPVTFINGMPYYYTSDMDTPRWLIIPLPRRHMVVYHRIPIRYLEPRWKYYNERNHRQQNTVDVYRKIHHNRNNTHRRHFFY